MSNSRNAKVRTIVSIPLTQESIKTRFVSFNDIDALADKEHVAILFGHPEEQDAPLVRIHSECLTGDVFGSQLCDCGEQLQEAKDILSDQGGILLYLRQEGRGIGLYNKLDAYQLQHQGIDTYTANKMLGFQEDLRDFKPAALMLKALSMTRIKLLSNNPKKNDNLIEQGIEVVETVKTGVYLNKHNQRYLTAKVNQHQHTIDIESQDD